MKKQALIMSAVLFLLFFAGIALAAPYEEWAGMYLGKQKMGYAYVKAQEVPGGYDITEEMTAALAVLGTVQEVRMKTTSVTDGSYRVRSFHFSMSSGFADSEIDGAVEGNVLRLKTGPGSSDTKEIKFTDKPFLSSGVDLYLQDQKLKPGDAFELPLFDPASLSLHNMKINVEAAEEMKSGEELVPVFKVHESYSGIDGTSWISPALGAVKATGPMGFVFIKEPKEQAMDLNVTSPPDIIVLTAVPAEGQPVRDPRGLSFMKLDINGADFSGMSLDGGRQKFSNGILTSEKENIADIKQSPLPVNDAGFKDFLEPEPFVQSKDPEMIKKAAEIIGPDKDSLAASRKLMDWVHENLRKYPSAGMPNALEVLHNLTGDCNEHAALFTALARAAGIPAKMDAGLVMMDGKFYYHAWNEVYAGRWITVDATFGQFPADASHIRLTDSEPDKQVELVKAVGKLRISVLEAR